MRLTGQTGGFEFVAAEHAALRPGRTARIDRAGVALGWLGELHPRLARKLNLGKAPILFELSADEALTAAPPEYRAISRYPSVRRDIAVVVDEKLPVNDLMSEVRDAAGTLLRDVRIFDIYMGDGIENGLKSVALGLILQETSRTLTELEIDGVVSAVVERLSGKFNATIRE